MKEFKLRRITILLLSMLLVLALGLSACGGDENVENEPAPVEEPATEEPVVAEPTATEEPMAEPTATEAPAEEEMGETDAMQFSDLDEDTMMLASNMLDREVENAAEEQLGFVDDLIIDQASGNVLFAIIEHGGFLDLGEEWVAVPLTAMSLGPESDELILDVAENTFENYPDLGDANNWPEGLDDTWDDDIGPFWDDAGYDVSALEGVDPNNVVRAENMVGFDAFTVDDNNLGTADDMLVDINEATIEYVLLSFVDTDMYGEDWVAVPWQSFDPAMMDTEFIFHEDFDVDLLQDAPTLSDVDISDTLVFDPTFDDEFETYWEDAGYLVEEGVTDVEAEVDEEVTEEMTEEEPMEEEMGAAVGFSDVDEDTMMLASNMLDREVENPAEEQLGFIDDLVIDQTTGAVLFAIIEHGGFLDLGEDWVAVPLTAMSLGPENDELILDVAEESFENYPALGMTENWPEGLDETWDDDISAFWSDAGYGAANLEGVNLDNIARVEEMIEYNVVTAEDPDLAIADDMLVDIGEGNIEYILLTFLDTDLYGAGWTAVPWDAFDPAMMDTEFMLQEDFNVDLLPDAPTLTAAEIGDTLVFDPTFDDEFETYWEDAGLAPEGAGMVDDAEMAGDGEEMEMDTETMGVSGAAQDTLMLASAIFDREVENPAGEQLGFVDDLVIDQTSGDVLFAIIEHGGFLDLGEDWVAVPLTAMSLGPENDELILDVAEETFEDYPDLGDTTDWPEGLGETWDDEIGTFWSDAGGYEVSLLEGVDPNNVIRAENLVGYDAFTADENNLATANDMLVDISEARIEYVLLSFVDTDLYGEEWAAVPWQSFDPAMMDTEFVFAGDFDVDLLQDVPTLPNIEVEGNEIFDPTFDDEVEAYWSETGMDIDE
jgi:sporulation protein YlmC with PRC-barrel domain